MDTLPFYKMSASGNDFILIDDRESIVERQYKDLAYFVERVCRRRHSVGADGLILVEGPRLVIFRGGFSMPMGQKQRCAATEAVV